MTARWIDQYVSGFERVLRPLLGRVDAAAARLARSVLWIDVPLARAMVYTLLAPVVWNALARLEYYTRVMSRACGGRRRLACALLAVWIVSFSLYRDVVLLEGMRHTALQLPQFPYECLPIWLRHHLSYASVHAATRATAYFLAAAGGVLVVASFVQLGFFGTFLGDYFGMLLPTRVTGFPFNVLEHPMYDGSTILFASQALQEESLIGLLLTTWVFLVYRVACIFEGAFTSRIYREAAAAAAPKSFRGSRSKID